MIGTPVHVSTIRPFVHWRWRPRVWDRLLDFAYTFHFWVTPSRHCLNCSAVTFFDTCLAHGLALPYSHHLDIPSSLLLVENHLSFVYDLHISWF